MKKLLIIIALCAVLFSCGGGSKKESEVTLTPIMNKALNDPQSLFYANFEQFPKDKKSLPIGVFDSGTGGLTVLEVLLNSDIVDNISGKLEPDGIPDFEGENFTYLADRANMPYGNYAAENKQDFFRELVVKDALFLLGNNYFFNAIDKKPNGSKEPCKIIVIACNTATAWGLDDVKTLLDLSGTGVKVIGVINAGVNALYDKLINGNEYGNVSDSLAVGVLATVGTISSNAYQRTIEQMQLVKGFKSYIKVVNQPGAGFAEAVDKEKDFVDISLTEPRDSYRGPVLGAKEEDIKEELLPVYNFDYSSNALLWKKENNKYTQFQLNSAANYARFHLVSLVEKHRKTSPNVPLKYVILGCTHFPFLKDTLARAVEQLREYKDSSGVNIYGNLIDSTLEFIDPAVFTALECYNALRESHQLALRTKDGKLDAYISIPSYGLEPGAVDENGNLTYEFKYGREYGTEDVTTVFVPFSKRYLDDQTLRRIELMLPASYSKIKEIIN